jgi:hypothetical protein
MYDAQVKEFESKLPAALPGCEVRFWREDRGQLVCYEIRRGIHTPVPGEIDVLLLPSSQKVDVAVRGIVNALPAGWRT